MQIEFFASLIIISLFNIVKQLWNQLYCIKSDWAEYTTTQFLIEGDVLLLKQPVLWVIIRLCILYCSLYTKRTLLRCSAWCHSKSERLLHLLSFFLFFFTFNQSDTNTAYGRLKGPDSGYYDYHINGLALMNVTNTDTTPFLLSVSLSLPSSFFPRD